MNINIIAQQNRVSSDLLAVDTTAYNGKPFFARDFLPRTVRFHGQNYFNRKCVNCRDTFYGSVGKCPHCGSWFTIKLNAGKPLQVKEMEVFT